MFSRLVKDLNPGSALRHASEIINGPSLFRRQHWLLNAKYPYYAATAALVLSTLVKNARAPVNADQDRFLRYLTFLFLFISTILGLLVLGGTMPIFYTVLSGNSRIRLIELACKGSSLMSKGFDRWSFFYYLTSIFGLFELFLTAWQGKNAKISERLSVFGTVWVHPSSRPCAPFFMSVPLKLR